MGPSPPAPTQAPTWCLLMISFSLLSSLGSISWCRKMLGRDRQLFWGTKAKH